MSSKELIEDEELSPVAAACLPRERNFVEALVGMPVPNGAEAARIAGFGKEESSTAETFAKIAYRLCHRDRVVKYINELCRTKMRSLGPKALRALDDMIGDPKCKDRARAVAMVLDRIDPPQSKLNVEITHHIDHRREEIEHYRKLIAEGAAREVLIFMFGENGLERIAGLAAQQDQRALPAPIEGEFTEVASTAGIEDLLGLVP